jgi:hypothetical protein
MLIMSVLALLAYLAATRAWHRPHAGRRAPRAAGQWGGLALGSLAQGRKDVLGE